MLFSDPQDEKAHKAGWLVLSPGEAYEQRLSLGESVFITKEDSRWALWRGYWSPGVPEPRTLRVIDERRVFRTFEQVFQRAQSYVEWRRGNRRRRGA